MIKQQQLRDHMVVAKNLIERGEKCLRDAAEVIAEVSEQGASQRQIAEEIGKSQAWVCRLLAWRAAGYADETPFGPESKAKRERSRDQAPDQSDDDLDDDEEAGAYDQAPDERLAEMARENLKEAFQEAFKRDLLVKALGMLGSAHDGERANAALAVEKLRTEMGLTWDELIVGDIAEAARDNRPPLHS